jgi:hypothetical protein
MAEKEGVAGFEFFGSLAIGFGVRMKELSPISASVLGR